jgi:hypothetical protein
MILAVRMGQLYQITAATPESGMFLVCRFSVTEGSG